MYPEEALVPLLADAFSKRTARVLVQELADHRLCDRMDDGRVRRHHIIRARRHVRRLVRRRRRTRCGRRPLIVVRLVAVRRHRRARRRDTAVVRCQRRRAALALAHAVGR